MSMIRTRWAAIGAAVAVTLGVGGIGIVGATSPAGAVAYVPITPCRLIDTRPAPDTVGTRVGPLGATEAATFDSHGAVGECTQIPAGATGLSLNVTATNATSPTFLTIYPNDQTRPRSSSLNPVPGAPATPNAVITDLSPGGRFAIYNFAGTVDVIVDVNGYFVDHDHDDRYYTKAQLDDRTAGDVIAMGYVSAGATPAVFEQRTAAGVTLSVTSLSAGRVDLVVTGADTGDVPIVMVTAHSSAAVPRTCNTRTLLASAPTTYTARVECYDEAGAPASTLFQFVVAD